MTTHRRNPYIGAALLPVDIVFHPSWWHKHAGLTFDEDFFYHPVKRVEAEQRMEKELYERFGEYGLGQDRDRPLPAIGAVHNAAGYLVSEMLGCEVQYREDAAPQVLPARKDRLAVVAGDAFRSPAFKRFLDLRDKLKARFGYLTGDVNWGGVLNVALDLAGENVFLGFFSEPEETKRQLLEIARTVETFVTGIARETGTTSISVNRTVRHIQQPVFLHSECSHTMISTGQYEDFLLPIDIAWSRKFRPFGIHYCGKDPHRYAEVFGRIENLDFLDVGWGGDVRKLRQFLPRTFLNLRLDPAAMPRWTHEELAATITRLVEDSGAPHLTGVCCINMDDQVDDGKIVTLLKTVAGLREKHGGS
jgi:hypothetical protein